MSAIRDLDYLVISARIKALENRLLSLDELTQILESKTDEDAMKILAEAGYPAFDLRRPEEMNAALESVRRSTFNDLADSAPDERYLDIFKIKYDYHNVKAVLKADALRKSFADTLIDMGRVSAETLVSAVQDGDYSFLPGALADAVTEAKEVLATTRDPQLSDIVLDRAMFSDQLKSAEQTGSIFLSGYVRLLIDCANLKALVRTLRMAKSSEFYESVVCEGGDISPESLIAAARSGGQGLGELFAPTLLAAASEIGQRVVQADESLTTFELACDNAVNDYLSGALYVAFGEAPLVGFLAALETEITNLRIVLMGRNAHLDPATVRSRLRNTYV